MRILGIESSCDETSIAIVNKDGENFNIAKNLIASQIKTHAPYGGVVPEIAAREHASTILPLLVESGVKSDGSNIDVIAVTSGPGLVPALRVGVELAKTLAWLWKKPLVGVNHLEGHIYSVWLNEPKPEFPALCLLVSGGHTEFILMKDHGSYELVGMTRDDAAGEAFDKVAKLLGLSYPGGPEISRLAKEGNPAAIAFPRPMLKSGDFDMSFSGLKTAVLYQVEENPDQKKADVAASFQEAVVDMLTKKTLGAIEKHGPVSLILSGGVSANHELRNRLSKSVESFPGMTFHAPELSLTGDNAVMIAIAGGFRAEKKEFTDPLELNADPNMRLV